MAYNGTKIVDFDSHLVGDVAQWANFIDDQWKDFLPVPLPTGPEERRRTLIGNQIMIGAEVTELIQGYTIAKTMECTEADLIHMIFPHPTLSEMMHESVLDAYDQVLHI